MDSLPFSAHSYSTMTAWVPEHLTIEGVFMLYLYHILHAPSLLLD